MPATIEIQTIRLDGRKLTATVYGQIEAGSPLDRDGVRHGTLLGHVNRHDRDCPNGEHQHVLWVHDDGQLCNALLARPDVANLPCTAADLFVEAARAQRVFDGKWLGRSWWTFTVAGVRFLAEGSSHALAMESERNRMADRPGMVEWHAEHVAVDLNFVRDELAGIADAYHQLWAEVQELPQLYIGA